MKKLVTYSCLLMLMVASLASSAQRRERAEYDPMAKPNIVKLNLTSLAFKNISLQYERVLGKKISVACGVRYMPKGALPLTTSLDGLASSDSTNFSDWKASSFSICPEFRFYPRRAGKGFYLAPYLRFRSSSLDLPVDYTDDFGVRQNMTATGNFTSYMGGFMIGSQFNLGPMVTLDWYIIGIQYGITKGNLDFTTTKAMSANDQADIRASFEDIRDASSAFNNITYSISSNKASLGGRFGMIGFRGFGLNLGFKF